MSMKRKGIQPLVVMAGLLAAVLVKSCGGGGGSSLATVPLPITPLPPTPPDNGGSPSVVDEEAITGRVLDPFVLLGCLSHSGAAFCDVENLAFEMGSPTQLLNLNAQGDPFFPAQDTALLESQGRFGFVFEGSITDPVGQLVRVDSMGDRVLRGFVFSAAVEVSPWSEALYRIILRERDRGAIEWTNITAAELRDLENILFTQVPLSQTARTVEELVSAIIQTADQLRFDNLRFLEDLIRVCYAPEGNQSDEPCRLQIPVPRPTPPPPVRPPGGAGPGGFPTRPPRPPIRPTQTPVLDRPPLPGVPDPSRPPTPEGIPIPVVLTNRAFVTVNGVTQSSNAVSIIVTSP